MSGLHLFRRTPAESRRWPAKDQALLLLCPHVHWQRCLVVPPERQPRPQGHRLLGLLPSDRGHHRAIVTDELGMTDLRLAPADPT